MEVNTMEGEINDIAREEVVMEDNDYAKLRNKVNEPKKRAAGETGPETRSCNHYPQKFSGVFWRHIDQWFPDSACCAQIGVQSCVVHPFSFLV
jgi:hypothetical protein